MSDSRSAVLGNIRRALKRGEPTADERRAVEARMAAAKTNLLPARGQLEPKAQAALFQQMAQEASATVARVADSAAVPAAIADYLARENLPARLRLGKVLVLDGDAASAREALEGVLAAPGLAPSLAAAAVR